MTDTIHLAPHDPLPSGPGRQVVVLRRFEEDDPDRMTVEIILTGKPDQVTHPHRPDGSLMSFDEAIDAAGRVAREEGLPAIYVLDRMEGGREHEIMSHDGDHSVDMDGLSDTDDEDGVRGSDMRDRAHPSSDA
jgi:hypothetical protein